MISIHQKVLNDSTQGGSNAGYSFYKKYLTCPRRFALEELLSVNTSGTKWALVQGTIVHGALEALYMGYGTEDIEKYIFELSEILLTTDEEKEKMNFRVRGMIVAYRNMFYEKDIRDYTDFRFEVPIVIPLYGGVTMTGRIDKLYRSKATGTQVIGDYKTTGMNLTTALKQANAGDQFTLYTHAMKILEPTERFSVFIDAIYGRDLKAGFKVDCSRSTSVVYTDYELQQAVVGFTGVVLEVAQKVKSYLNDEAPLELLFPRNGTVCGIYGCPYMDFCRRKVTGLHLTGAGCTFDREKVQNLKDFKDFNIKMIREGE